MFWDIAIVFGIGLSQLFVTIYAVWVSVTENKLKTAAIIAAVGALGIVLTVYGAIRSGGTQQRLEADIAELKKGQQTANAGIQHIENIPPPAPVVNVSPASVNFPAQEAFVTITERGLEAFKGSQHIMVNFTVANLSSAVPALSEYGYDDVYLVEAQPIGINNKEMLVSPAVEDKYYKSFVKAKAKLPIDSSKTIGPQQSSFASGLGPILDEETEKEIRDGNKAIFLAAEFFWEDEKGKHVNESCQWLQPSSFHPATPQVWHYCNHHNGIRK
jgi:hypothetical protein